MPQELHNYESEIPDFMMTLTVPVETALPVSVAVMSSTNGVDVYVIDLAVVITPVSGTIAKSEFESPPENKIVLHYFIYSFFFLSFFLLMRMGRLKSMYCSLLIHLFIFSFTFHWSVRPSLPPILFSFSSFLSFFFLSYESCVVVLCLLICCYSIFQESILSVNTEMKNLAK